MSLDMDGVIADSRIPAAAEFNRRYGTNHNAQEITSWESVQEWGLELGMTEEEAIHQDKDIWSRSDVLFNSPVMPGALEFLTRLHELGVKPPVITSRLPIHKDMTIHWFRTFITVVSPEQLYIRANEDIEGENFKPPVIEVKSLLLHVDDAPNHGEQILRRTKAGLILLSNDPGIDFLFDNLETSPRFIRLAGMDGRYPDMWPVYNIFFANPT